MPGLAFRMAEVSIFMLLIACELDIFQYLCLVK